MLPAFIELLLNNGLQISKLVESINRYTSGNNIQHPLAEVIGQYPFKECCLPLFKVLKPHLKTLFATEKYQKDLAREVLFNKGKNYFQLFVFLD